MDLAGCGPNIKGEYDRLFKLERLLRGGPGQDGNRKILDVSRGRSFILTHFWKVHSPTCYKMRSIFRRWKNRSGSALAKKVPALPSKSKMKAREFPTMLQRVFLSGFIRFPVRRLVKKAPVWASVSCAKRCSCTAGSIELRSGRHGGTLARVELPAIK